ncbi:MAG: DUF904 domain-containing protein [Burkholderiaceae bacterium]|nr:DUF904 domain-containing protein [Burkholderiaceae bacterium]
MVPLHPIEQIAERIEQLLQRLADLQRTNTLQAQQVSALTQERDSLKSRLKTAQARADALSNANSQKDAP